MENTSQYALLRTTNFSQNNALFCVYATQSFAAWWNYARCLHYLPKMCTLIISTVLALVKFSFCVLRRTKCTHFLQSRKCNKVTECVQEVSCDDNFVTIVAWSSVLFSITERYYADANYSCKFETAHLKTEKGVEVGERRGEGKKGVCVTEKSNKDSDEQT